MSLIEITFVSAGCLIFYLNIVATHHIFTVDTSTNFQKFYQNICVWFVPVLGAIFVISFHLSDKEYVTERKERKGLGVKLKNIFTLISLAAILGGGSDSSMSDLNSDDFGGFDSSHDGFDGGGDG